MGRAPELNCRIEVDGPVLLGGAGHAPAPVELHPDRPAFLTTEGVPVWMERKRQRTRFLDAQGRQVGPVHANFVPAVIWAAEQGWRDPSAPDWLNDGVIAEVAAGRGKTATPTEGEHPL